MFEEYLTKYLIIIRGVLVIVLYKVWVCIKLIAVVRIQIQLLEYQ